MSFDIVNTKPSGHDLKKMKQIHHEIALLAVLGHPNKYIAEKLGVTPAMVSYTLDSTLVKRKLSILRGARDREALDIHKRLEELAPLSLDELEQMLLNPNTGEMTKRMIAQDLLDRAGYGSVQKHADVSDKLTTKDINEIKEIARQNGMVTSDAVDVEYEDIPPEGEENTNEDEEENYATANRTGS